MSDLKKIKGLGEKNLELLEAIGIDDLEDFAEVSLAKLYSEIELANKELRIVKKIPSQVVVEKWLVQAREMTGIEEDEESATEGEIAVLTSEAEKEDDSSEAEAGGPRKYLIEDLPKVAMVPGKALMKAGLKVSDIPVAKVVPEEDLNKVLTQKYAKKQIDLLSDSQYVAGLLNKQKKKSRQDEEPDFAPIDVSKVQSIDEVNEGAARRVEPLQRKPSDKLTSTSEGLNKGLDPSSRRYIKGVLHSMPERIYRGAFITLLIPFIVLAGVVSIILSVTPVIPEEYKLYAVGGFIATPFICGIAYLFASSGQCIVCRQRQFIPKQTRKNKGAHHIPGLGHIIPTALHVILFKWFRCIYCATSVRLKE